MIALPDQNALICQGQAVGPVLDCKEFQFIVDPVITMQKTDLGKLSNLFVDSDIFVALRRGPPVVRIIFTCCSLLHVDYRLIIDTGKRHNASGMIIVAVTQNDSVHFCQVDAQCLSILKSFSGRTQVHQQPVFFCLYIKREPVCISTSASPLCILNQIDDSHICHTSFPDSF